MIKQLQLYTIFILIMVIVLSQFTLLNDSGSPSGITKPEHVQTASDNGGGILGYVKGSKYAKPAEEVQGILADLQRTISDLKRNLGEATGLLDIEKNLEDLSKVLQ